MSNAPKTKPKALRGKGIIAVDQQIFLWRQRLKRDGIKLGRHMVAADRHAEKQAMRREVDTDEKLIQTYKKRFGG